MTLDKVILGLVSVTISILGLSGETGSRVLSALLLFVCLALFLPPTPKAQGSAADKTKVTISFLSTLKFAAVAWVSVVGSGWLIADWARAEAPTLAHRSAHQRIIDWQDGVRVEDELKPVAISSETDLRGSYIIHAGSSNGTWLVPLASVVDDTVESSLGSLEEALGLVGVLIFFLGVVLQGMLNSGTIVRLQKK